MGAWTLGRDAALLQQEATVSPSREIVAAEDPRSKPEREHAAKGPREEVRDTLASAAGKVLAWIPGEVVVIYGALITVLVQNDPDDVANSASIVLTAFAILFAGAFVVMGAFANTSGPGWFTKRVRGRATLAATAFALWS